MWVTTDTTAVRVWNDVYDDAGSDQDKVSVHAGSNLLVTTFWTTGSGCISPVNTSFFNSVFAILGELVAQTACSVSNLTGEPHSSLNGTAFYSGEVAHLTCGLNYGYSGGGDYLCM